MKTQRQFLSVAWLAACALLLLSACRGPAPIAGRATEITAAGVTSNTPLPASTPLPSRAAPTRAVVTEQTPTPTVLVPPTRQSTPRSADATATPAASVTNTPDTPTPSATDTPVPDETPTPSPTPEITAPVIAGLSLKPDGKGGMQYVAEKGNPYGVAVGEVVGRASSVQVKRLGNTRVRNPDGTFEEVGFVRQSAVVISNPKVLAYFTNKENTPDKVRAGEWKIALPFEPGPETRMWEHTTLSGAIAINFNGLQRNIAVVNPYHIPMKVISFKPGAGLPKSAQYSRIKFLVPNQLARYQNVNWGPGLVFNNADVLMVDNAGKQVAPGEVILRGINGVLQPQSTYGEGVQAQLHIGSQDVNRAGDFSFRNVLQVYGAFVFAESK